MITRMIPMLPVLPMAFAMITGCDPNERKPVNTLDPIRQEIKHLKAQVQKETQAKDDAADEVQNAVTAADRAKLAFDIGKIEKADAAKLKSLEQEADASALAALAAKARHRKTVKALEETRRRLSKRQQDLAQAIDDGVQSLVEGPPPKQNDKVVKKP